MSQSPDLSFYRRYFPSLDLEVEGKESYLFRQSWRYAGGTTGYRCDGNLYARGQCQYTWSLY